MNRVIVIQFITLDGVVEDPDGSAATPAVAGVPVRPEGVAGDKFKLGAQLDTAHCSWAVGPGTVRQALAQPLRRVRDEDERGPEMGGLPDLTDVSAWNNSTVIEGELTGEVHDCAGAGHHRHRQHQRRAHIDGARTRRRVACWSSRRCSVPAAGCSPADRSRRSRLVSVEQSGPAALLCYESAGR